MSFPRRMENLSVIHLDIVASIGYAIRMEERIVRYSEQHDTREEEPPVQGATAPMVERAFRLLELLSTTEEGLTLSDLARALHMSKGSMHGLLKTLESSDVIEAGEERRFVLGPRIYELGQRYIQRAGLRRFAIPAMQRLARSTGETVCLGKAEQKGVRIIECIVDDETRPALHIAAQRGLRVPLLAAATGPFVLASWSAAQREVFLNSEPLPRFTEHSLTDPKRYMNRVDEAVRAGVSFDHEEYLVGVNAVAAPIYGTGGTLLALLWIVGFASQFLDEHLAQAAQDLRSETITISCKLGSK